MVSEKEKENREKLFQLMRENPELPVVAMVNSEVVADTGYGRWTGAFGYVYIAEYVIGLTSIHFREEDDPSAVEYAVRDVLDCHSREDIKTEKQELEAYRKLPWIKAIIVDIDLPCEEDEGNA